MKWLAAALFVLAVEPAFACKCAEPSRERAIKYAHSAFKGRVTNIETNGTSQVTTMVVTNAIKNASNGATMKVYSTTVSAACGYDFRRSSSKVLTVVGQRTGGKLRLASRCSMIGLDP